MNRLVLLICLIVNTSIFSQLKSTSIDGLKWSERIANSVMKRHQKAWQIDNAEKPKWEYKPSFVLFAFEKLYNKTHNEAYFSYIKEYIDIFVDSTGSISNYKIEEYNLDLLNPGKLLFGLYNKTKDEKYFKALQLLKKQIDFQPKTASGGFWHKKIYPNQM